MECASLSRETTCHFQVLSLWLSHGTATMVPKFVFPALHGQGKGHQRYRAQQFGEVGERENGTSTV